MTQAQTVFSASRLLCCAGVAFGLCACTRHPPTWRQYREVEIDAATASTAPADMAMPASGMPAAESSSGLAWTTPEGWTESKGSGMRLATFTLGADDEKGTCTIVVLGGEAGGLEANVLRWLRQLGQEPPPQAEFQAFLQRQTPFATDSGLSASMVDLTELTPNAAGDGSSMIGCIVSLKGRTAFLKLTGTVDLLRRERGNLLKLCRSLRTSA